MRESESESESRAGGALRSGGNLDPRVVLLPYGRSGKALLVQTIHDSVFRAFSCEWMQTKPRSLPLSMCSACVRVVTLPPCLPVLRSVKSRKASDTAGREVGGGRSNP